MKRIFLISISLIFLICSSFTDKQLFSDNCLEELKTIFRKFSESGNFSGGQVYFFEYDVKTSFQDKKIPTSNLRVKMVADKDHSRIQSKEMELYQDRKYSFMVLPLRKVIYWGNSQMGIADSTMANNLGGLQLKMLDRCKVRSCTDVSSVGGDYNKEILLAPDAEMQKKYGFNEIKFQVNAKKQNLYKVEIKYGPQSKWASVEMHYLNIDYDYKKEKIAFPVESKFLTKDGKLVSEYKGYKLVDIRKR